MAFLPLLKREWTGEEFFVAGVKKSIHCAERQAKVPPHGNDGWPSKEDSVLWRAVA